jgi:hypothetical protein
LEKLSPFRAVTSCPKAAFELEKKDDTGIVDNSLLDLRVSRTEAAAKQ